MKTSSANGLVKLDDYFIDKMTSVEELMVITGGTEPIKQQPIEDNPHCNDCSCNNCDC